MENTSSEILNSVKFLFAKPYSEGFYEYAVDNLNDLMIIDKDSLKQTLLKLKCMNFTKVNYLMDRNFPFLYDIKNKKIMEFEANELNENEVHKMILDEISLNSKPKEISTFEKFFGEDSNFYKQNFEEILYGNNKSIQGSLSDRKYSV